MLRPAAFGPAGWSTLFRNGLLAALAGIVLWRGSEATFSDLTAAVDDLTSGGPTTIVVATLSVLVAAQTFFIYSLLRQNGRILLRLDELEAGMDDEGSGRLQRPAGLPVGTVAPAFALAGLHGETMTLEALRAQGKATVLLFTDPDCEPCNQLMPDIGRWQRTAGDKATIVVVSRKSADANAAKAKRHGLSNVLLQKDTEVADAYRHKGTPSAVVVGTDGKVTSALAAGAPAIRRLIEATIGGSQAPQAGMQATPDAAASTVGKPAPTFELPDLSGRVVASGDLRGSETLVLFWNPSCGFCRKMLDDLKAWEAQRPSSAPQLLIVSRGDVQENVAMGLRSRVVLDQAFDVASRFGVTGTPIAVLVDEDGRIASSPAVGAQAVLALAGATPDAESA